MKAHTPEPWNIIPDVYPAQVSGFSIEKDGAPIAHVPLVSLVDGRDEANARLIALAPELLRALEAMTDSYANVLGVAVGTVSKPWEIKSRAILEQARAVLAKV